MTTRRSSCTIGPTAASGNMGDGASVGDMPDTIGSESVFWESDEPGYVTAISEGAWEARPTGSCCGITSASESRNSRLSAVFGAPGRSVSTFVLDNPETLLTSWL